MISMKNLIAAPVRLQRMLLQLQQFDMTITYRPGKEILLADALSHLPSWTDTQIKLNLRVDAISISAFTRNCLMKIAAETQWDPILSTVHISTLNGWPNRCTNIPRIARNYWDFHDELLIKDDLLMKGEWVIIPPSCRDSIMDDLHKSHAGISKALALARMCVYWPGMEVDVTDYIKRCLMCIENSNLPRETLHPHEVPPGPWVKLGMDFFQDHQGKKYLIIADYFSKFPYIFPVASAHHFKTINHLRELFTAEGIPTIVMSDNGPPFNGDEFKRFAWEFNFMHTTSSPHFHQSNGFIEAMVKKVKNAYKKTDGSPNAQARALLQLWDTPILTDLPSPAEILHGCPAQSFQDPQNGSTYVRFIEIQNTQKEQFNRAHRAKDLQVLKVKEQVQFIPNKQGTGPLTWMTGTVTEILNCGHSYMIQGPNGRVYRRNRAHLKHIWYDGTSFQDHAVKKEGKKPEINSFQDPKPTKVKTTSFQMDTSYMDSRSIFFYESGTHQTSPSSPSPSSQWLYSPRPPSYSPPASLPSRESSVEPHLEDSSPTGRKRHQSEPAFMRPHDVNRGLTPRLSALLQETSPLAPYKLERSAKARARQAFSTMHWTPFKTLWRKSENWCKSTPFKTPVHSYAAHSTSVLTPFKTPVIYHQIWLISRPLVCIQY